MVLVDVYSRADTVGIEFGVELRRIHVGPHTEGLDRAVGRGCEGDDMGGERSGCLLVPAGRGEDVGQICKARIGATGECGWDRHSTARLAVGAVDGRADNRTERAHAVTASEKGKVAVDDTTDQAQELGFDALLRRRLRFRSVADVVRSAAKDDAGPFGE